MENSIWRLTYSPSMGVYWMEMRAVNKGSEEYLLDFYQKGEPGAVFCVSAEWPKIKAGDEEKASELNFTNWLKID